MAFPIEDKAPTRKELRSFGVVMAVVLSLIGLWGVWRVGFALTPVRTVLLALAAAFITCALVAPTLLREPRRLWLALGERLGVIVSTILLSIFFFLVITPVGLLRRAFGADPMGARRRPDGEGYWVPRDEDPRGPERYEHMF